MARITSFISAVVASLCISGFAFAQPPVEKVDNKSMSADEKEKRLRRASGNLEGAGQIGKSAKAKGIDIINKENTQDKDKENTKDPVPKP